jgi:precorrin-8X/cobalt-precorrin-8 methylmutase
LNINIEKESYRIIDNLIKDLKLPFEQILIIKRVIHATADLEYSKSIIFHPQAITSGLKAIYEKRNIITDVNMVRVGISKYNGRVICLIDKEEISNKSLKSNITRTAYGIRQAINFMDKSIVVIGNAPTALLELCRIVKDNQAKPALIIATPVGFVYATEAKEKLQSLNIPYITNRGRKGGSSVAVAIVNALLKLDSMNKIYYEE